MGKRLCKKQPKRNIPLLAAAVLSCVTLLSVYLVTGLVARYTTTAKTSDQARVAKFSITSSILDSENVLQETIKADLAPGDSITRKIQVKNDSEVAVEYTMEVANKTRNLPLKLTLVHDTSTSSPPSLIQKDENYFKYTNRWLPGSYTDEYLLTIEWPEVTGTGEEIQAAKKKELALTGMVDHITVTVTAVQTD